MNEEKRLLQVYNILDKFEENFLYKLKGLYQSRETYFKQRLENYYYALINNLGFEKYFQELLLLLFREGVELGRRHASNEINILVMKDPYEKMTKSALQYWDDYAIKLSKIEDKDLLNKLKETLNKGMKEGKSIKDLQEEISKIFPNFQKIRCENIARTETGKAYNYGRLMTYYENSDLVQAVKVSAIMDDRTCDICLSRNGMIIPLTDTGAIARNAPPFHFMCRCTLLPITIVDKRKPNYKQRKYQNIPEPLEGFGLPDLSMITKAKPIPTIPKVSEAEDIYGNLAKGGDNPFVNPDYGGTSKRELQEYCERHNLNYEQFEDEMNKHLQEIAKNTDVCIEVKPEVLDKIAKTGKIKSQFETGKSGGLLDTFTRDNFEKRVFGYKEGTERPIYGYITSKAGEYNSTVSQYGNITIKLKSEIRERTTYVFGDSLDRLYTQNAGKPVRLTRPNIDCICIRDQEYSEIDRAIEKISNATKMNENMLMDEYGYIEAQIHGGVYLKDIDSIYYHGKYDKKVVKLLNKQGIKCYEEKSRTIGRRWEGWWEEIKV